MTISDSSLAIWLLCFFGLSISGGKGRLGVRGAVTPAVVPLIVLSWLDILSVRGGPIDADFDIDLSSPLNMPDSLSAI